MSVPPDWRRLVGNLQGPVGVLAVTSLGLLILAILYTLYFARDFLVPVTAAFFLNFLLTPVVRLLHRRLRLPTAITAILVFVGVVGATGFAVYRLSGPAFDWMESAPARVQEAESKLRSLTRSVEEVREAVDQAASGGEEEGGEPAVEVQSQSVSGRLLSRAGQMLVGLVAALFLLLFLLSTGDLFLRRTVGSLNSLQDRRRVVEISRRIEQDLSRYLLTQSLINAGLGVAVGTAMWLWGMPNPMLWGVLAALLNFIPYLGGFVGVVLLGVVGLVSLDEVAQGLMPALTYLVLNGLEAYLLTPAIMGRRFSMNPVAVFLSVLFWGWIWGVAGALMAVPILTTIGIVCSRIERLSPLARFLES